MSRTDKLAILQGIGVTLQMINTGLVTVVKDPFVSLIVSAVIGGYQYVIQHIGNITDPKIQEPPAVPVKN